MSSIETAVNVASNGPHNVQSVLARLSPAMTESYVLMETSRSLHRSSLDRPRLIAFGTDARFLLAVASAEGDPRREVIEMAELDAETGLWRFRALDMAQRPPQLSPDDSACRSCHGSPPRPIWGSYRQWLGAFGGGADTETLTAAQAHALRRIGDTRATSDRFFGFAVPGSHSLDQGSFFLTDRRYGYANTAFNFELGARIAEGLFRRIRSHAAYPTARWHVIAGAWCVNVGKAEQALAALGLDLANDMDIANALPNARATTEWNTGSTSPLDILAFLVLDEAAGSDVEIAQLLAPIDARRRHLLHVWWQLRGDERRTYLRDAFSLDEDDLRPQELVEAVRGPLCTALDARTQR